MDFVFKTKGNSTPNGKAQIYFSCHPDDFVPYFEGICDDIFASHDCVIHYKQNMAQQADTQDLGLMLDECQLFVVPVTYKLLSQENRVMLEELPLARSKGMPVLPLMMEGGLDMLYRQPNHFGEAQYLEPSSDDITGIAYSEKLKKYLNDVLIDRELAARIEKAFRGRIFLSYRKKDRHYANALIRLIHEDSDCKDLSVWYDEFLTPGESYSENIQKAMETSDIYLLLVTPNLLEDPNYVKDIEYPAAKEIGLPILPVEMVRTDMESVFTQFPGVFRCLNPEDEEERALLLECIKAVFEEIPLGQDEQEVMERFYLIGRGYFSGIGVETDRQGGAARIEVAAKYHHIEAMQWIYGYYRNERIYERALRWAEELVRYYEEDLEAKSELVFWLREKSQTLRCMGSYDTALEAAKQAWELVREDDGKDHPPILSTMEVLDTLESLGSIFRDLGHNSLAGVLLADVVDIKIELLGLDHPETLESLQLVASVMDEEDGAESIIETYNMVYSRKCKIYGSEHPSAVNALAALGAAYNRIGQNEEALECLEKAYEQRIKYLDPNHPDIWIVLENIANTLLDLRQYEEAYRLAKEAYKAFCDLFGPEHPHTLIALHNLSSACGGVGKFQEAYEFALDVYQKSCTILGVKHPNTITCLSNLAFCCMDLDMPQKAISHMKEAYELACETHGQEHPKTSFYKDLLLDMQTNS